MEKKNTKLEYYRDIIENHPDEIWKITDRIKENGLWKVIDLPGEEWRKIKYAPLYYVSNFGRVKIDM